MRLIDADKLRGHKPFTIRGGPIGDYYEGYSDCAMEADEAVQNAPTVDAVPVVHGRWQVYETEKCTRLDKWGNPKYVINKIFHCPLCEKGTVIESRFCPHCGAKMDLEDE